MSLRNAALLGIALLPFGAKANLVADQIGASVFVTTTTGLTNQNVPGAPWLSWSAVDDFVLPQAAVSVNYFEIVVSCGGSDPARSVSQWQGTGPWRLNVFVDNFGQPGSAIVSYIYFPGMFTVQQCTYTVGTTANCLLRFPTTNLFLPAGVYWFNCTPDNPLATRVFGAATSSFPSGSPNNFNAIAAGDPFNPLTFIPTGWNLAFRVDAT